VKAAFLDYATLGAGDLEPTLLQAALPSIRLYGDSPADTLDERLRDLEVVIVNKIVLDQRLLACAPRLRLVCVSATGTDNVALATARGRGIAVTNVTDYCVPSVTQHVFALVLSLTQRLREYHALLAEGAWQRSESFCLLDHPFHELAGRTFGIVGLGALGRGVARVAQAFGMTVLAAQRPYREDHPVEPGPADADGVQRISFRGLLARAHVVSLHCPLTAETRRLIDARAFSLMRHDALLINTARGALVDPAALLQALHEGRIAGAGVDVLEREPPPAGEPLLAAALPNLIVTPHMAWAARESRQRLLDEVARNVGAFLSGERRNRVD
jgi:glycerate dehydrogenase